MAINTPSLQQANRPNKRIIDLPPLPEEFANDPLIEPVYHPGTDTTYRRAAGADAGGDDSVFPEDEPAAAIVVGNIPVGYDLAGKSEIEVLRQLLSQPYQFPGFASFTIQDAGSQTVEVGTPFPAGFKSFKWSIGNNQNVAANSITIQDETAGTTLITNTANDGVQSLSTVAFAVAKGLSRRYRITGRNTEGGSFSAVVDFNGLFKSYFGYSTSPSLSGAELIGLASAQLQNGRGRTVSGATATGGAYTYYAYEAAAGDLANVIMDGALPVLGSFQKLPDVTTTNALGATVTLRVYRSNATNAFDNNTLLFS